MVNMTAEKKILFVNPPLNTFQRYGQLSQAGSIEPPLGLAYLASIARESGFRTTILDFQALGTNLENSIKLILKEEPKFIGISLATMSLKTAVNLSNQLKKIMPDIKIIVGGPHFSALPVQTLFENDCFDIGVIGEAEKTLEELLNVLINGSLLSSVAGIAFKSEGRVVLTSIRERSKNLDELPLPAFDLLPELKKYYRTTTQSIRYLPTTSLVTSRGCTGKCIFCDRSTFGNVIRMHSAEYVADMMEKLQKDFGIRGIIFEDDNFMLSEERLFNLARFIKRRKIKIYWSALSRIDTVTEEKLKIAKSCGCWQILYGIESGSQKILDFYKKGITLEQIKKAVYLTKNCGLYVKGFFMLGNPLESVRTLQETRDLIKSLPLDDISLTYFTPYPGADIWGKVGQFGKFEQNWDKLSCFDLVFIPQGLSKGSITSVCKSILKEFYFSVPVLWAYLRRLRSFSQVKELYQSFIAFLSYSKSNGQPKSLIINADDFGLCGGTNRGVEKLLEAGIVKSVSIMPTGYAFESAINIVRNNPDIPDIDVGVHLSLTETKPIQSRNRISSLTNKTGKFEDKFSLFFMRYLFGGVKKGHIIRELRAQIEKVKEAGLEITHLDSHQHIHILPGIFKIVLSLAKEYEIPFIRLPSAPLISRYFLSKVKLRRKICQLALNFLCVLYKPIMEKNGIHCCDYSFGFLESGNLSSAALKNIISSLKAKKGQYELVCHPAEEDGDLKRLIGHWGYRWQQELIVFTSDDIKGYLSDNDIEISRFN
jgi:radical SAM superfamily enzyme YgiQ (UPF0313 family)/predicted glycoside hydrolase/deacetylase ChbG (UPF0249 family)